MLHRLRHAISKHEPREALPSPPPPSLPPGEYDGGTHGYYAHYTYRPWHVDEPPNHRMSINDVLHEAGREVK